MVYEWKTGFFNAVDANTAGAELERIYNSSGTLEPEQVVDASRPKKAPLHDCFEWDDAVAAEEYRKTQAGCLIRNIVVKREEVDNEPVRAFVSVQDTYRPLEIVLESKDMTEELLQKALRELRTFENKYRDIRALAPVFVAIDEVGS